MRNTIGRYQVCTAGTDGVALLDHPSYGRQVWVHCRLRKPSRCAVTGRRLPIGAAAYRPITNQRNRRERICEQFIRKGFPCK